MRTLIVYLCALLVFLSVAVLSAAVSLPPQSAGGRVQQSAEVAGIESYCKGIDLYLERNPKAMRYFVNKQPGEESTASRAAERWYEVKSGEEMSDAERSYATESISVLMKSGEIVYALIGEPMEHSRHDDGYYFRAGGSLAKIRSTYWSNMGEMKVVRESFYNVNGKLLRATSLCYELINSSKGSREKRVTCSRNDMRREIQEYRFPIYKINSDLPGYALLKKP